MKVTTVRIGFIKKSASSWGGQEGTGCVQLFLRKMTFRYHFCLGEDLKTSDMRFATERLSVARVSKPNLSLRSSPKQK